MNHSYRSNLENEERTGYSVSSYKKRNKTYLSIANNAAIRIKGRDDTSRHIRLRNSSRFFWELGQGLIRNSQKVKASVSNTHCNHADTGFSANPDPYPAVYLIRI
jgi:hypothetical protein